ncbi:Fe-S protein assembly co-chaperone HscB [Parvibium lacunae]|nr:Fe-S protein assembly co-chaperone HscB [Parvibium lacunae]
MTVVNASALLSANFFELLGLPQQFALDREHLSKRWRELQAQVHPDRYVQASATEQRLAMQVATRVNEAYQTLLHPLKRAVYLCELHAIALELDSNTTMPQSFLLLQMTWREALAEAKAAGAAPALMDLEGEIQTYRNQTYGELADLIDQQRNYPAAASLIRQLFFIDKISQEVTSALAQLEA